MLEQVRKAARALALAGMAAVFSVAAKDVSHTLDLVGGIVPVKQRYFRVAKDDLVTVRILSEVPGDLRLGGYRLEVKVVPGKPSYLRFKADTLGRFDFTWQPEGEVPEKKLRPPATVEVKPR